VCRSLCVSQLVCVAACVCCSLCVLQLVCVAACVCRSLCVSQLVCVAACVCCSSCVLQLVCVAARVCCSSCVLQLVCVAARVCCRACVCRSSCHSPWLPLRRQRRLDSRRGTGLWCTPGHNYQHKHNRRVLNDVKEVFNMRHARTHMCSSCWCHPGQWTWTSSHIPDLYYVSLSSKPRGVKRSSWGVRCVLTCHCRRQLRRLLRLRWRAGRSGRRRQRQQQQQQQGSLPKDAHTHTATLTHMSGRRKTPGLRWVNVGGYTLLFYEVMLWICKYLWLSFSFYSILLPFVIFHAQFKDHICK